MIEYTCIVGSYPLAVEVVALKSSHRLELLTEGAAFDVASPDLPPVAPVRFGARPGMVFEAAAGGRCLPLFKVLLSNQCRNDCHYCALRSSANVPRAGFTTGELVQTFLTLLRGGRVQGMFLSSAVCGSAERTQERMLQVVEVLRHRHHYRGYIHLKLLPGVSDAAIEASLRLADRLSVNLEAPSVAHLARIAPDKAFRRELLGPLERAAAMAGPGVLRSGLTTQFVVGGAEETDREVLGAGDWLYRKLGLRRAYYSGFRPLPDTPLEGVSPASALREHRLYQADFLLRHYDVGLSELVFSPDGGLPTEHDPKLAMALAAADRYPLEVNRASKEELLRVPGLGPVSVERILSCRRERRIRDRRQLAKLGVRNQALEFLTLAGRYQGPDAGQLILALG